jgi:hypothetical protein
MANEIPQDPRHLNAIADHFEPLRDLKGCPKTSSKVNRRPFSSCRKPCLISFIRARLRMISLVSRHPSYSSALMSTAAGRPFLRSDDELFLFFFTVSYQPAQMSFGF